MFRLSVILALSKINIYLISKVIALNYTDAKSVHHRCPVKKNLPYLRPTVARHFTEQRLHRSSP